MTIICLPTMLVAALAVLAAVTVGRAALAFDAWGRRRGTRLLGVAEDYRDDGVRLMRWCVLHIAVVTLRRTHSTWLQD